MTTDQSEVPEATAVPGPNDPATGNSLVVVSPHGAPTHANSEAARDFEATVTCAGTDSRRDAPDAASSQSPMLSGSDVSLTTVESTGGIACAAPGASAPTDLDGEVESLGQAAEVGGACDSPNRLSAEVAGEPSPDEQESEPQSSNDAEPTLLERLDRRQDHVLDELDILNQRVMTLMKQIQAERELELRDDDQALASS